MEVLVIVDAQKDFMNSDGALYVPNAEDIKGNIEKLADKAIDRNITMLLTADYHDEDDKEFEIFPPHCVKGKIGQQLIESLNSGIGLYLKPKEETTFLQDELIDEVDGIIFTKATYNIFDKDLGNMHFGKFVKDNHVETAIVCGVATDYCVKAAVLGLLDMGVKVVIVSDAIKGVDVNPGDTDKAMEEMTAAGAILTTTEEI